MIIYVILQQDIGSAVTIEASDKAASNLVEDKIGSENLFVDQWIKWSLMYFNS
jgi:hypothetical protein